MSNRRDFLKLSTAGLCSLYTMQNLAATNKTSNTPKRFIFLRKSNGTSPKWLIPPSLEGKVGGVNPLEIDLDRHDLPDWMAALTKHKKHLTILQNLSARMCGMGHSTYQSPLAVCKSAERVSTIRRASVDTILGDMFKSPFGHIEMTCARNAKGIVRGMSSIGPQQPNFAFASPKAAYENLFVLASDDKQNRAKNTLNNQMQEFISANINIKNKPLPSKNETLKLGNYAASADALVKRNKTLAGMAGQIKKFAPSIPKNIMSDNYTTLEQQEAFADIILSTLYAGLSNVVTFTLDSLETGYTGLFDGQNINLHTVGHNKDSNGVAPMAVRSKLRTHHVKVIDKLVEGLKKMPEGRGSMFDNTMIMYLPENGEAHHSIGSHVPFIILAGDNCKLDIAGRYIQLPGYTEKGHKTLGNWYTTILNAYGNPVKHYGDLDARLKINQKGPIEQFL